jgi:glyceraldehyde-3-phosphate dehydrogenase (NADP+)
VFKLILGGKEADGHGSITVRNPFDGSAVAEVARAGRAQVNEAVRSADGARRAVASLSRGQRADVLRKVADRVAAASQDLAANLVREVGKTIREARLEVDRCAATFRAAGDEAGRLGGEVVPFDAAPGGVGRRGFYQRVPVGTVVAITPFNFPLNLSAHKVAPAIAAGNPFILKPASQTPTSGLALGKMVIDAGYPPEAVSVLPGAGDEVGMALVEDPRPRMVTFTGSAEVGKRIAGAAGIKRLALELGSNAAVIVTRSADLEFAARRIVQSAYALAGQVCISVQRVLVDQSVFDEVAGRVVELASALETGDPMDEATDMGPMISEGAAARLKDEIEEAVTGGARARLVSEAEGALMRPVVLTGVPVEARVWKDEAFGPVVSINAFRSFDEAIETVNASRYGLQAGVFTASLDEAWQAVEKLEAGGVIVNDTPTYRVDHMPYGGVKDSGIGREGLKYAIEEMTEIKLACFNFWRP